MRHISYFSGLFLFFCITSQSYAGDYVVTTVGRGSSLVTTAESIMTQAYERLGHQLKVVPLPAARSLISANSGESDGDLWRATGTEFKYKNLIPVPVPIVAIELVVFSKGKSFTVEGWESLVPYKVGYRRGLTSVELNLKEGIETVYATSYDQIFKMLDSGRCDVVIASRTSGSEIVKRLGLAGIEVLEGGLGSIKMYHFVHRKNEGLVKPLTRALQQMIADGYLDHLE
jgi:polar amino acid transport system substrate-binding protein